MSIDGTCANRGCKRLVKGRSAIVAKNGDLYCKNHGEKIPSYLRAGSTGGKGGGKGAGARRSAGSRGAKE
jgi:hypothetical protein